MKQIINLIVILFAALYISSCTNDTVEYNNPEVGVFVKQLKAGTYNNKNDLGIIVLPDFAGGDIPDLLKHADDLTVIPSFPTMYTSNSGKIRLVECILCLVESIRIGMPASVCCNVVAANE